MNLVIVDYCYSWTFYGSHDLHFSQTFEALLSNWQCVILRQLYDCSSTDPEENVWRMSKFTSEVHLMRWLLKTTDVPVPHIHHVVYESSEYLYNNGKTSRDYGAQLTWTPLIVNKSMHVQQIRRVCDTSS